MHFDFLGEIGFSFYFEQLGSNTSSLILNFLSRLTETIPRGKTLKVEISIRSYSV